jgi:hypothetical protein
MVREGEKVKESCVSEPENWIGVNCLDSNF